ncbi:MAG: adenylate cyclase, partial [Methylobacteriaceae bacterium]|nr:adenylate cyclase [Methylobacteriaceae bacterium]
EDALGKIRLTADDLGLRRLKNIGRSIHVYAVRPAPAERLPATVGAERQTPSSGAPQPSLPLPDKPSIAVLPFANLSADPEQDYFADGVVDDIINALSRVDWLFVIARNSSFTYKGRQVGSREVGRELGVRYLLEGSVRRAGPRLRLNGQLVEADTGHNLWAERFDGKTDDVFALQDMITERVVCSIEPRLRRRELERLRQKPTNSLEAYDLCLRALPNIHVAAATRDTNDESLRLLHQAIAIDPNYALARALAAWAHFVRKAQGWSTPAEDEAGARLAEEAFARHQDDPHVLGCAGHAFAYLTHRLDFAQRTLERAVAIAPNSLRALNSSGWVNIYTVQPNVSLAHFERAIRLSPVDPEVGYTLSGMSFSYHQLGRYADGVAAARKAIDETPNWTSSYRGLIINLVGLGEIEEAREVARRLLELDPDVRVSKMSRFTPVRSGAWVESYAEALRASGIPE